MSHSFLNLYICISNGIYVLVIVYMYVCAYKCYAYNYKPTYTNTNIIIITDDTRNHVPNGAHFSEQYINIHQSISQVINICLQSIKVGLLLPLVALARVSIKSLHGRLQLKKMNNDNCRKMNNDWEKRREEQKRNEQIFHAYYSLFILIIHCSC